MYPDGQPTVHVSSVFIMPPTTTHLLFSLMPRDHISEI